MGGSVKLTMEELKTDLGRINKNISILTDEYIGAHTKIEALCLTCKNVWNTNRNRLLNGHGCPKCSAKSRGLKRRRTLENIISELSTISPNIKILSDSYTGSAEKLECKCLTCSYVWKTTWDGLKQGANCPMCAKNIKSDIEDVRSMVCELGKKIDVIEYARRKGTSAFRVRCQIDGHEWLAKKNELKKHGCAKCANKLRLTIEDVVFRTSELLPNISILSKEYVNSESLLRCGCDICGNIWDTKWAYLSQKCGCPECGKRNNGWNKSSWIKKAKMSSRYSGFKVYILKCYNEDEEFYKVGITFLNVKERYTNKKSMPYNYEVVKTIESDDGIYIWELEKKIHTYNKEFIYSPKINFDGAYVECFSKVMYPILEIAEV